MCVLPPQKSATSNLWRNPFFISIMSLSPAPLKARNNTTVSRVVLLVGGTVYCNRALPLTADILATGGTSRGHRPRCRGATHRAELEREGWTIQFIPRPAGQKGGDWYYYPPSAGGARLRSLVEVQRWKRRVRGGNSTTSRVPGMIAAPLKIVLERCPLCGAFSAPERLGSHIVAC